MKPNHGGRREGAGRKPNGPEKKVATSMMLLPDTLAFLRESGQSVAETTEAILRKSKAFKDWKKGQANVGRES